MLPNGPIGYGNISQQRQTGNPFEAANGHGMPSGLPSVGMGTMPMQSQQGNRPVRIQEREQIVFPGIDGAPFRGANIPSLKADELDKLVEVWDTKVRVFDTSEPEQLKQYQDIWDKIGKGVYIHSDEQIMPLPEKGKWMIMIRYAERYKETPGSMERKLAESVATTQPGQVSMTG